MVKKKDSPRIKALKHKAGQHSIREGIFASAKSSFGDSFVSPFAIAINTSNPMVAMLSSISGFLGPLSQIFGSKLIEKHSRKKIILKAVFLESLMWLPFIAIAFLFQKGIITNILPLIFLFSFSIYSVITNMINPIWFSWMGDIIDEKFRGRFFSKRSLLTGFVSVVLAILASFFLDYFKEKNWTMYGFAILFFLALISRLISLKSFKKQYEPKIKLEKGYYFSFWQFLKEAPKTNFGKFAIFRASLFFSAYVTASLLTIYLIRILGFDYKIYMIITFAGTVFSLIFLELWGKFADKYGNYKTIYITSVMIPIIPILWILSPNPIYLILVPSFLGGIYSAGFNLSVGNFIYDNVTPQKRGLANSYFHVLNGIGVFLGAGVGALLIKFVTSTTIEPIKIIFIIGAVLRIIPIVIFLPKIKETRKTKRLNGPKEFVNMVLKETKPTLMEEANEIIAIKKYIYEK